MINLSVNVNKIATLRNARGGNIPNVQQVAMDCERFGANGITVHPRPDERHTRRSDVFALRPLVRTEFNIEGYPSEQFMELVLSVRPTQATLVPDGPNVLTSSAGWDVEPNMEFLTGIVDRLKDAGIRTSIFVNPDAHMVEGAKLCGADRVELYTEPYAANFLADREAAIAPFIEAAKAARDCGLGLNAGHDLSLVNLHYFHEQIPWVDEVSIGHAIISDALYMGLRETIRQYLKALQ
jgi:pyridoxine 5-phosphate synthase